MPQIDSFNAHEWRAPSQEHRRWQRGIRGYGPEEVHMLEFDFSRVDLGIQPVIKEVTSATLSR